MQSSLALFKHEENNNKTLFKKRKAYVQKKKRKKEGRPLSSKSRHFLFLYMSTRLLCHISLSKHPASRFFFFKCTQHVFVGFFFWQNLPPGPPVSVRSDPTAQSVKKLGTRPGWWWRWQCWGGGLSVSQWASPPSLPLRAQLTHSGRPDSSLTSCKQNTRRGRGAGGLWVRIYWVFVSLHNANMQDLFFLPMSGIFCNSNILKCFKIKEYKGKYLSHIDTDALHIDTNIFTQLFEPTGFFVVILRKRSVK